MHDNPDPDAIAAGWGVWKLVQEKLGVPVRLLGGGAIVRAENRLMVELLQPPLELVDELPPVHDAAVVLVDCGLETKNQLFARWGQPAAVAVIDHHVSLGRSRIRPAYRDVRPAVTASATLAASYLREQQVEPGTPLATAMLYAIRTETRGALVRYSRIDRSIGLWLTQRADPDVLSQIEQAPLSRAYFGDLLLALQSTYIFNDAAVAMLPRAEGADTVGEVADLLSRCQGVRRVLCGAVVEGSLILSVRTASDGGNAAVIVAELLAGLGHGGGHEHRAGGKIPNIANDGDTLVDIQDELCRRWLTVCDAQGADGIRLVPTREIIENL
jgi:nanoRNase/pAp phosphatase (c-di-AMP/oligoRNAs hydrolase)